MLSQPPQTKELPVEYTLQKGFPPLDAYLHLRRASGLTPKTEAQAKHIPSGSWYGVCITFKPEKEDAEPEVVGMGRIIGDGGWYFHIADMAVLPAHQRRGLGDAILSELLRQIREKAPEGDPYINLFADKAGRRLYEKHGFEGCEQHGQVGMSLPRGWRSARG